MQVFNTQFLHKDEQKIYAPLQHLRTVIWMLFCSGGLRPSGSAKHLKLATPLGFEPRITPPKGAVLPLHHGVWDLRFRLAIFGSSATSKIHMGLPRRSNSLNRGGITSGEARMIPVRLMGLGYGADNLP